MTYTECQKLKATLTREYKANMKAIDRFYKLDAGFPLFEPPKKIERAKHYKMSAEQRERRSTYMKAYNARRHAEKLAAAKTENNGSPTEQAPAPVS